MQILKMKLVELQRQEREAELDAIRGVQHSVGFGSQIRSYVLAPYRLAKDHRTGFEMGDVDRVLDGDLDGYVEAWLQMAVKKGEKHARERKSADALMLEDDA